MTVTQQAAYCANRCWVNVSKVDHRIQCGLDACPVHMIHVEYAMADPSCATRRICGK